VGKGGVDVSDKQRSCGMSTKLCAEWICRHLLSKVGQKLDDQ